MSETLVNTIDGDKLYAERAVKDASGNSISETYATKSEIPVVDQAYDATSTNAQSGVAVAEALSNVPSSLSAGDGIDITSDVVSAKVDGSTISFNASGELQATVSGGVTDVTVDGTSVVNGQGVAEITMPTFTQVQSDWSQSDNTKVDYIKNKPTINNVPSVGSTDDGKALVAHYSGGSGSYSWDNPPNGIFLVEYGVTTYAQITNALSAGKLPVLKIVNTYGEITAAVLSHVGAQTCRFSIVNSAQHASLNGDYFKATVYDLVQGSWFTNSIDVANFQSDWNQTDNRFLDYIKNKPSLATVATTGAYSDLSGTPTIPAAQVQSDWNQSDNTQVDFIKNKPNLATVATTGAYSDLSGTPTINNVPPVGSTDDGKVLTASYSGGVGSYSWTTPSGGGDVFIATYGVTSFSDILTAINSDKAVFADGGNGDLYYVVNYSSDEIVFSQAWCTYSKLGVTKLQVDNQSVWSSPGLETISVPDTNWVAGEVLTDNGDGTVSWQAPTAQVQSDWSQSDNTQVDFIKNKPTLATVATTGAYSDLSGTPTIPAAQVNSDWNASSGVAEILNKPTLATVATSGSYNDLSDKPTIPTMELFEAVYGTTTYAAITSAIAAKKIVYCRVSPSGATRMAFLAYIGSNNVEFQYYRSLSSRSATSQLDEVYVYTVNASGWTTTTRKTGVLIKAGTGLTSSYASGTLTINGVATDQTYNASSANPQSGVAVAGALAGKEDAFTVGDGLEMVTSGNNRTLQVEAPVDIVAGPGIVIDNPDGNTMRVSQQYPTDETVLWEKSDTAANNTNFSASLSETIAHFKKIKIYAAPNSSYLTQRSAREYIFEVVNSATQFCYVDTHSIESNVYYGEVIYVYIDNYTTFKLSAGVRWQDTTFTKNIATYRGEILKISGVQRIASN